MTKKLIKFLFLCLITLSLGVFAACSKDNNKLSVEFGEMDTNVKVGDQIAFSYDVDGATAYETYEVSDVSVACINDLGFIEFLKAGNVTVTLTLTCDDEKASVYTKSFTFTVTDDREFTITFDLDGGTLDITDKTVKAGESYTLPTPTKAGAEFLGWSLEKDGTEYVSELTNIMEDTTVYANYKNNSVNVTYYLNDGTLENQVDTVSKGEDFTFPTPTKTGYVFLGWTVTESGMEYVSKIEDVQNDIEIYAHYDKVASTSDSTCVYYLNGGSLIYDSREAVIADFLKDFNKVCGKSYATAADMGTGLYSPVGTFDTFYANKTMYTKWKWLLEFLIDNAGTTTNANALKIILNGGKTSGSSDPYSVSYEFRAFLQGTSYRPTSSTYKTKDYSDTVTANLFWTYLSSSEDKVYECYNQKLPTPSLYNYDFDGWYKDSTFTDGPYKKQEANTTYYAKWIEGSKVTSVVINNTETEIKVYDTLQLTWTINPSDANIQDVKFYSSDSSIATVDKDGNIQTLGKGEVTITVKSLSSSSKFATITLDVYKPDHFEISYESNSYVEQDGNIQLNAAYVKRDGTNPTITWESKNTDIATVDANGMVTGVKEGVATITATAGSESIDFVVTVLNHEISEELQVILDAHNSNANSVYNLGIGAGTPEYYYDVTESVSKIIFDDLTIDRTYYDKLAEGTKNNGTMSSVEFITVHYTGNMNYSADADNNCDYFNNLSYAASIHFVTGRSNLYSDYSEDEYYAFAGLNEKYGGWHASDTKLGNHEWIASGVMVSDDDPETPVFSVSENSKYTINGKETTISIPERADGIKVTGPTFMYNGVECKSINDMGLAYKIVDGQYYLGNTWWGTQQFGYTLSNIGGNYNSIGIESCVDKGSDLMHTWHVTAQLVAQLMLKYDLDITRVVGHHFFSGKDCPQPMLENNMELWYVFLDMVQSEYDKLTKLSEATVTMEVLDNGNGVLSKLGLITKDADTHVVTYKVKVEVNGKTEEVTLATAVNSYYECNEVREYASLQIEGYEVK